MSFEPIGLLTVLIGLSCLLVSRQATIAAFILLCNLGSAAAIQIGGSSIQPGHLSLMFVIWSTVFWRKLSHDALFSLRFAEPGFWFMLLTLYGIVSSYMMPRLFAGMTNVVPLGTSEHAITNNGILGTVPLGPISSNLAQSIYLVGDLTCFVVVTAVGSTKRGFETLANALIAYAAANICFGLLDIVTSATGTQGALQFIRNAQYTFHDEESVNNMRRIVGSWPEASAFAGITLETFAFTGALCLYGRRPAQTGPLALLSLLLVILSTSSAGLVGSAMVLVLLSLVAASRCGTRREDRISTAVVVFAPQIVCAIVLFVLINDKAASLIYNHIDTLVLSKSSTSSGEQRSSWNIRAWNNFIDTWGLGVGLGTNRTSNFALAVLSNVGLLGAAFYAVFLLLMFGIRRAKPRTYAHDVQGAAKVACLSALAVGMISGPTVDQGLLFYVLAGVACARPEDESHSSVARRGSLLPDLRTRPNRV